jgi:hypothetical protein
MIENTKTGFPEKAFNLFALVISMAGYVPKNATFFRTIGFIFSLIFIF